MGKVTKKAGEIQPSPFKKNICGGKIPQVRVDDLAKSIKTWKWWGGLLGRQLPDGTVQLAFGHSRLAAVIQAYGENQEIGVSCDDRTDDEMLHLLSIENDYRSLDDNERLDLVKLLQRWLTRYPENCRAPASGNSRHQHAGPSCIQDFIGGAGWTNQRISELLSKLKTGEVQQQETVTAQDQKQAENQTIVSSLLDSPSSSSSGIEQQPQDKGGNVTILEEVDQILDGVVINTAVVPKVLSVTIQPTPKQVLDKILTSRKNVIVNDLEKRVDRELRRNYRDELVDFLRGVNV